MIVPGPLSLTHLVSDEFIVHSRIDAVAAVKEDMVRKLARTAVDHGFTVRPRHVRWTMYDDKEMRVTKIIGSWMPLDTEKVELVGGHVDGWFVLAHRNNRGFPPPVLHVGDRLITGPDGGYWLDPGPDMGTVTYHLQGIDTRGPHWVYRQVARPPAVAHTGSS